MFHSNPEENDLFQAIATVTSLVLQIGEAGHRRSEVSQVSEVSEVSEVPESMQTNSSESEWTVSFAQILASLLTEQALVNFFEKPVELSVKLAAAKEKQYHQRAALLLLQHKVS